MVNKQNPIQMICFMLPNNRLKPFQHLFPRTKFLTPNFIPLHLYL